MRSNSLLHPKRAPLLVAAPFVLSGAYASANNLTGLITDLYAALDVVSRELVGMIPSVSRNASAERAAVGQQVKYHITEEAGTSDIVPAMVPPEPDDKAPTNDYITITKAKKSDFGWTGEEQRGLNNNNAPNYMTIQQDLFIQAMRKLTNEIEQDLYLAGVAAASAATGTPGTTPFATSVADSAQVRKLLDDAGAPPADRSLVGSTSMGAALRSLANLTRANEAGTTMTLRDGELLNLNGLSIKESGQARYGNIVTAGTAAGATTNATGYAIGTTTVTLASAGTGTIVAGDFIKVAGDARAYRVVTGDADVSGGGTVVIAAPGLMQAIPAVATGITVMKNTGGYELGLAFPRSAIQLACRAPALPEQGDSAIDRMQLTDPRSGMTYEVSLYAGYRKISAEVAAAWGWKVVKKQHMVGLFG